VVSSTPVQAHTQQLARTHTYTHTAPQAHAHTHTSTHTPLRLESRRRRLLQKAGRRWAQTVKRAAAHNWWPGDAARTRVATLVFLRALYDISHCIFFSTL